MKRIMLRDICELYDGLHATPTKIESGPIYLGIDAITEDGILDSSQFAHLSEEDYVKWTKKVTPQENDIVFSYEATLGRYAMIPPNFRGCLGRRLAIVRVINKVINVKWLYYYFKSPEWMSFIKNQTVKGSTVDRISIENFPEYTIPSVPLEEQNKIVDILDRIDRKIVNNKRINDYLEQQALLIFNHMFPNISYGLNHVGDYIIPRRGKALLSKDAISGCVPVIAGGLVPATYHNMSNTIAPVLTISGSGANAGYINIWYDSVWSSDSSYIDSDMTKNVYFWYAFLKSRQQDIFDIQTGSAQPHIYPKHIAELSIGDINNTEVELYTSQVTPLFTKVGDNIRENNELKLLRDWLLPMLMNGQAVIED